MSDDTKKPDTTDKTDNPKVKRDGKSAPSVSARRDRKAPIREDRRPGRERERDAPPSPSPLAEGAEKRGVPFAAGSRPAGGGSRPSTGAARGAGPRGGGGGFGGGGRGGSAGGGSRPPTRDGFADRGSRDGGRAPRRDGFAGPPGHQGGPRPDDRGGPGRGAARDDRGPPRDGGFARDDRRPGGDSRPRREGGFGPPQNDRRPPSKDGGFSAPRSDDSARDKPRFASEPPTLSRPKIRRIIEAPSTRLTPTETPTGRSAKSKFDRIADAVAADSEPLTPPPSRAPAVHALPSVVNVEDEETYVSSLGSPGPRLPTLTHDHLHDHSHASHPHAHEAPPVVTLEVRTTSAKTAAAAITPPPPSGASNVAALVEATLEDAVSRVPELRAVMPTAVGPLALAPTEPRSSRSLEARTARAQTTHPIDANAGQRASVSPRMHTPDHGPTSEHVHASEHGSPDPIHDHEHGHAHGHAHGPSDRKLHRDELALGAGRGKVLFLDAPSGLAGDMIVGALVDLGVPEAVVLDAIAKLGVVGFHVHFGGREQSGIVGTRFDVHVDAPQPERTFKSVRALILASDLPQKVKDRALLVFEKLGRAEAKVHKMPIDDVHFHEVGAVDALCDVVGAAAALEYLGAEIVVSPLPMGRGFVKARHGILPLPAPAAVECLTGLPTYDAGIDFELVTPTGAAIVGANASRASRWPDLKVERVGWGAGTQSLPDRPNLLRVVLGSVSEAAQIAASVGTHAVLEANLDDATGEIVAHCIDMLLREGALDAWATPSTTKKGRPGLVLSCLVQVALAERLTASLLRESTTIGVRRTEVSRVARPRRETVVQTPYGPISVKISEGPFGTPQQKPEFDECVRAAAFHRVPVREVLSAALEAARSARET